MSLWAGFGGAARHASVALASGDGVLGVCEQERITRVRTAGANATGIPDEALDALLSNSGCRRDDLAGYAVSDSVPRSPISGRVCRLDQHFALACGSFLASPFQSATILICDHEAPHVSVWRGDGHSVSRLNVDWEGPGFAEVYSQCAEMLGFSGTGADQRLEGLARLNPRQRDSAIDCLFELDGARIELRKDWQARIADRTSPGSHPTTSSLASALQTRIGDLLLRFIEHVRHQDPDRHVLCVGGRLFLNSSINTRVKQESGYDEVYIPVNPAQGGLAIGAALHASHCREVVNPFLGPEYNAEEIKATLDNCKLSYDWLGGSSAMERIASLLKKGLLVGWFDGRMEWGSRALGARSILASPFSPYVLDNLNRFLKKRDSWRGYALAGPVSTVQEQFAGPSQSTFMECDYAPRDRTQYQSALPGPQADVRIQTVGADGPPRFRALLRAFGEVTGVPVLINTSFNGFQEPIVCSPRDAVRVFYGTGIDVLVLGEFIVRK